MSCPHEEALASYALGTAETSELVQVEAHLRACAACSARADELARAADLHDASLVHMHAPNDLRDSVLAAVGRTPQAPAHTAEAPAPAGIRHRRWWQALDRFGAVLSPAFAVCSVVLAIMLIQSRSDSDRLQRRVERLSNEPQLAVLKGASISSLDTSGPFNDARAQVAINYDTGVLALRDVPEPPDGSVWQVWQVDEDDHIESLGTIDHATKARLLSLQDIEEGALKRILVTVEAGAGSESPSDDEQVAEHTFA